MADKIVPAPKKAVEEKHPGMLGDGTEEQNSTSPAIPMPASSRPTWTRPSPSRRNDGAGGALQALPLPGFFQP